MRLILLSLILVVTIFSSACSSQRNEEYRNIAAPADALALTPLGDDEIAVLGGGENARNVTLERARDGSLISRFGVTREAAAIAARSGKAIYLGLAWPGGGAVEEWGLDGRQRRTVPMPAGVIGFGASERSTWAFVRGKRAFAAVEVPASGTRPGRVIPLPSGTSSLAYCAGTRDPTFVISEHDSHITLVRIRDAATTDTTNVGQNPVCSKSTRAIYALSRAGDAAYLIVVKLATLLTVRQTPTMLDAAFLVTNPSGELIVLGKGSAASSIRIYARDARDLQVGS